MIIIIIIINKTKSYKIISALNKKIKSLLKSRFYAKACNEWRGPSSLLNACRRNFAAVLWRAIGYTVSDLTATRIVLETYRAASNVLTTEPTGRRSKYVQQPKI